MKIFIDFDNVVFNTSKFKRALVEILKKSGVTAKDFSDTYEQAKNGGGYSFARHVRLLSKKNLIRNVKNVRQAFDRSMTDLASLVFRDAYMFFMRHEKEELYLLSYGDPAFQKKKIAGSRVGKYFKRVIITKGDKGKEIVAAMDVRARSPRETVIFIDDSDVHIREAHNIAGVITIQLSRGEVIHKTSAADYHVSTLAQASKIIESL